MSPLVRLVGGEGPTETISVSLEHTELVLADLRGALPALEYELRKKWPTLVRVEIEDILPRRKNPIDATSAREYATHMASAGLHLVAIFAGAAAVRAGVAFGKEVITPPAKEVGKFLRQWVQKFTKTKSKHNLKRKRLSEVREKIDRGLQQLDEGRAISAKDARARLRRSTPDN